MIMKIVIKQLEIPNYTINQSMISIMK